MHTARVPDRATAAAPVLPTQQQIPLLFWPFVLALPWWHRLLVAFVGASRACEPPLLPACRVPPQTAPPPCLA